MDIDFIQDLETQLSKELPGVAAQIKMAPASDQSEKYLQLSDDYKIACVLIVLFPKNEDWHVVLIERSLHSVNDKHAGQLSLPGGKMDETDRSLEDCALRETYEEIGLNPSSIGILGELTPLFVHVSNFLVHPFVGFTTEYPKFIIQESEVNSIIEVPLRHFLDDTYKKQSDIEIRDLTLKSVPNYKINKKALWGATAMVMSEFEHILKEII